jgi:hypothetical protein
MPAANTEVDICKLALQKIGAATISSIDEDSTNARACKRLYQTILEGLLTEYTWPFAKKRAVLARKTSTPEWGFDYEFTMPADYLRLISVQNNITFELEGNVLLTDELEASILYIQNLSNPVRMNPLFVRALYLKLAIDLAPALATSAKVPTLQQEYKLAVRDAIQKGAAQRNLGVDEFPEPDWTTR